MSASLNSPFVSHPPHRTATINEPTNQPSAAARTSTTARHPPPPTESPADADAATDALPPPPPPAAKRPPVRGALAIDLNAELKSRLKKSTHASVGNLKKSATVSLPADGAAHAGLRTSASASRLAASDGASDSSPSPPSPRDTDAGAGGRPTGADLGRLLRRLPVREPPAAAAAPTSDGDSSGGQEVKKIVRNGAVARSKKFKDG